MSIGPKKRFRVFARDKFRCMYCGRKAPDVTLHVDHIISKVNGGSDEMENLATACEECNLGKGGDGCYACGMVTCPAAFERMECPDVTEFLKTYKGPQS